MLLGHLIALISNAHLRKRRTLLALWRRKLFSVPSRHGDHCLERPVCIEIDPAGAMRLAAPDPMRMIVSTRTIGSIAMRIIMRGQRRRKSGAPGISLLHDVKQTPELLTAEPVLFCLGRSFRGSGGARRDRTDDLKLAKLALSQLSYGPVRPCGHLPGKSMVGLGRFELPTSRLSSARSNQLSYRPGKRGVSKRRKRNEDGEVLPKNVISLN